MKNEKKSVTKKIVITIIVILAILIVLAAAFIFYKLTVLNSSINNPLDRKHSELRNKPLKKDESISIALFGIDSDEVRASENGGQRSDSIVLLSINPKDKKTEMISVPRDTHAKIVGKGTEEKINHAYAYGGPDMAVKSVEKLMDVPIDHYAAINMDGVSTLIDELNGVDVVSNADFKVRDYSFEKGKKYHMVGKEALAFMRSRKEAGAGGDEGRQVRQQLVIEAVAKKSINPSSIPKINSIFNAVEDNVKTDLSLNELNDIRSDYKSAQKNVKRHTLNGENKLGDDGLYYFVPSDNEQIREDYRDNLNLK
ncbi:LCP family protein [Staphylococcus saprophyticus]|jgi:LCP family protein required for cell wall assembly|uniref:LCP family protein n=1 Tax=Staphylococcus saprophyticus TaxID=29385 RepID=UPI0016432829|nr:LCP family protein [Staphylococcus saprophyticus]MBC2920284.1 LCP family protein [Staphylococcus saprophyticus]MBC2958279.1 LCP family protein [Staphylococcus saprophyticus]MBC3008305.1 LCP family protein [Staphylococcus saprophyticus]MBC3022604.1 LCP family protein [Staphylococcus saprophyticus]MBC3031264.1 LCP family protein [Staphylococcus saprophyticus]